MEERQALDLDVAGSTPAPSTKVCPKCQVEKPVDAFNRARKRADGLQSRCRVCQNAGDRNLYQRSPERRNQIRARAAEIQASFQPVILELKASGCLLCPEKFPACLQFHHIDPEMKDMAVSEAVRQGWSRARVLAEIKKCVVLCANCHVKVHCGVLSLPVGS